MVILAISLADTSIAITISTAAGHDRSMCNVFFNLIVDIIQLHDDSGLQFNFVVTFDAFDGSRDRTSWLGQRQIVVYYRRIIT